MRFNLSIKLGNDAMRTPDDVGEALADIAGLLGGNYAPFDARDDTNTVSQAIYDTNGNRVGSWEVAE